MAEAMAIISSAQRMAIPTIWLRRIACHSLNAFNRCFTGFNALPVNVGYPPRPGFHAVCRQYPARSTRCVVVVFYHAALRTVNGRQRHRKPPATDATVVGRTFPRRKSTGKGRGSPRPRMLTKSIDWQSVEKACKQGNFVNGKICRQRRLDLTIPKGSANPPKEANLHPRELTWT